LLKLCVYNRIDAKVISTKRLLKKKNILDYDVSVTAVWSLWLKFLFRLDERRWDFGGSLLVNGSGDDKDDLCEWSWSVL
jgi:hypothetical protein